MSSPKRDVRHRSPTVPGCTAWPGLPVKSGDHGNPVRSPSVASLPLLAPAESGGRPPRARPSPAFLRGPRPGRPLSPARFSPVLPALSTAELPRLVAEVGPGVAAGDCLWTEGPRLMASALGVHIPLSPTRLSREEEPAVGSVTDEDTPMEQEEPAAILRTVKKTELRLEPLTGMEVADIFLKKRLLGKAQFVHLKAMEGNGSFRPYDLRAVPQDQAGPEHYIFSSSSVLHVRHGTGGVGFQTLGDWHREALQWNLLQDLPFFRNFRLRRAFTWWRGNVRRNLLRRARDLLQEQLLIAVPQFREALLQVSRLIEELKQVHWLPQDDSRSYTLQEFHSALVWQNEESRALLGKFLQYRSLILNMVREDSCRARQDLQEQVERAERAQPARPGPPLHLQRAHRHRLRQDLHRAEGAAKRLANVAALVDHMTVQSLATVAHREVAAFLRNVVTRSRLEQGGLFLTELVFGTEGQLAPVPPVHLLQEALQGALCSVADSVLQVIDSSLSSGSEDWVAEGTPLADAPQDLTPDPSPPGNNGVSGTTEPWGAKGELRNVTPRPVSPAKLVLPNAATPRVEGQRLRGHCYPLSRPALLWQLTASVGEQEAQGELARVTQEAQQEVQQLCDGFSWLGEVQRSCSLWSSASLEAMRGWPSQRYREHIQRVQAWAGRLRSLPACFTTSNRLITVRCSHTREKIGPQLASMEEEVLTLLQEEVQQRSEALVSQLKTAADWLRAELTDLDGFSQYASRVKQCERQCADLQSQGQYLRSLRETLRLSSRSTRPDAVVLEAQVQDGWNQFLPLLQQAGEVVRQRSPSMADALDRTFSSLTQELQGLVSRATSGPYVDPTQESAAMVARLQTIHGQFCAVAAQLEQMKEASGVISNGEKPLDISFVTEGRQKLEDRKALWELLSVSASYIHEWRQLLFSKFVVLRAQEKVDRWLQQAVLLERTVPPCDMVLKHVLRLLEGFRQQLPLLAELSSPTLRRKHWGNIFKGMELLSTPERDITVADLLSTNLLDHRNMIIKVCQEARAEADVEQAFRKLQRRWEETPFRLANFLLVVRQEEEAHPEPASRGATPDGRGAKHRPTARRSRDSGTFIVIGLEALLSQTQASITTLSSMLPSPHAVEFRREVERWVQQLQELEELLDIWKRYQLKWTYLSKMFHEFGVITQKPELYRRFLPVDGTYREMIETVSRDPRVLNFAQLGHGHPGLRALLAEGLTAMEEISAEMLHLLEEPRRQFPRLRFLSDGEVTELLSLHPEPSGLLPLVRKCFQGVQELDVAYGVQESPEEEEDLPSAQPWVRGVFGGLGERLPFLCPVGPSLDPLAWLRQLEQQLHRAMVQLMADCAVARQRCRGKQGGKDLHRDQVQRQEGDQKIRDTLSLDPLHPCVPLNSSAQDVLKDSREVDRSPSLWDLISGFPLQCLLVVEEALWCEEVRRAFRSPAPAKRALLKAHYDAKLQSLCQLVRDASVGRSERSSGSQRAAAALRAMTLLSIKHSRQLSGLAALECELESSFEWQRLMKYHLSADDHGGPGLGSTGAPADGASTAVSCYVDVLSSRLPYGYELLSPECWTMVHTASSDRAALGIILALTCYRCGFVGGPSTSGKTETAVHLGQALGRHVVTLRCCPETSTAVVLQMLTGALQTGAWLLLDSADSMSQGALSLLGQHLSDIHHGFSFLLGRNQQQPGKCETEHEQTATAMAQDSSKGSIEPVELQVTLGGRTVSSKLGYGCVLLSSSRRAIEVPENLRIATRPVSLLQPDYGVIAEATLAASGFSEAASMSRRLVSLLSLARDLACLPESSCAGPTSWLVLLTRVLTFAGIHLNQSMRVEWEKDKVLEGDQEAQRQLLHLVLRAPEGLGDGAKGARPAKSRRTNQCVIVLQAIAEEQAVIKAVTLAVASAIVDPGKASHFHAIFEEMFPGARCPPHRLQGREEKQQEALKAAVVEELQDAGLQPSPSALSTALALYRALKLSRAVVLLGQAGSGKTTCYRALAGALRRLAGRAAEEDGPGGGSSSAAEGTGTGAPSPAAAWSSVDTAVVFPNALSTEELWGGFSGPQGCWQYGAITKALRESQELSNTKSPTTESSVPHPPQRSRGQGGGPRTAKWLVLDGEPLGRPGWLDPLCTLCDPKDPFLSLPTGEQLRPPPALWGRGELKVLVEATGLEDASPAAVARCGLVLHSAGELWRAVWRAQLEALGRDPGLDPRCLRVWSRLADDLFARTLSFLGERRLAPVLPEPGAGPREVTHGVQEVMSFSRVLCALKEQFGSNRLKAALKHTDRGEGTPDTSQKAPSDPATPSAQQELQARNVFVVAYVWGFGGHLHPRHWPHFDEFARGALYESRDRVALPAEASVFEYFVHLSDRPVEAHGGPQNRSLQVSCSTVPQYERYVFLLRLMLKARQPALLVGEPGSGKTTLCHSALGPKVPHLRLPACALLRAAHLRALLEGVGCQSVRSDAMTTVTRQPGLLLFLDDLHDAPCDAYGKASMALEALRQCMTTGGVLTPAGRHFRLCSSGALSFLASCATPGEGGSGCGGLSPRLSRLFSVLALPDLSEPLLFSIHSPRLQLCLGELPLVADMRDCILAATLDLYRAVRLAFPPRADRPHFLFSPHDLRKVFQGMCLWRPPWGGGAPHLRASRSSSSALAVVRLWAHECLRTFWDRLCSEEERGEALALLTQVAHRNFASRLASEPKTDGEAGESSTPNPSAARDPGEGEEEVTSSREESPASSLEEEEEDEDHTETGEQGSSSFVSDSLSEQDALSEILSDEPEMESVNHGDTDTLSETSRTPSTVQPSPRKEARPRSKPDGKRSGRLVVRLPQCTSADRAAQAEQSPVGARTAGEPLRDLGPSLLDPVFGPDLSGPLHLHARLRSLRRDSAYKEQDAEGLAKQLAAAAKLTEEEEGEGEEGDGRAAGYGVHGQGVRQLARVLRALLLPGGHGVLLGGAKGTGRKTAVRLAARLTGCRLLEVHSGNAAAAWDALKEAGARAGVRREGLVLLVHESASQEFREELLVAMGNRTFPTLYSYKEWKISSLAKGSHRHEEDQGTERYFRQVPWNVHVFLLLPLAPGGECPGAGGFWARALSLCSCVEVYQPWTTESLIDVATHHLKSYLQIPNLNPKVDGSCLVFSLSQAMAGIHQSARRYASVLTPDLQPFGPQTFMEFLSHFLFLCAHLYDEGRSQANRMAAILSRMKELTDQADQYSQEVSSLRTEFTEAQQWQAQLQRAVEASQAVCERARQHCLLEETQLALLEEQLQEARQLSQDALQQVSPLYQAALEAMQSLSQSDLEELRRYRRPPEGVMAVMDVVCMLFGRPCTWESCQQLLGRPNFLQELEFYDRSALSGELFAALSAAVARPGFEPEAARGVSRACESLCRWARAVHQYARARRSVAPHEARRARLEEAAAQTRARLRVARLREEEARAGLEEAERRLGAARREAEELAARLRRAETRERDAAAAVQQVAPHIADWSASARETERGIGTVPGDALTLAAALAYLGPFGPDVRSELLGKWRELCLTGHVETDPEDPRTAHLSAPSRPAALPAPYVPIPLGEDPQALVGRLVGEVKGVARGVAQGVAPALLLNLLLWACRNRRAQHCPLLADAQQREGMAASLSLGQCSEGKGQAQGEDEYDLVVSGDDPALLDKLREGAEKGLTVLVTHVERARPTPGLLGLLGRRAGAPPAARPGFSLSLSTSLPVGALLHEIHPLILAEVRVVDLSLSGAELQELTLAEMMQSKCPQIWSQDRQSRAEKLMLLDRLRQQEASLMEYVLQSSAPLLEDPRFLPRVSACQAAASGLRAELLELDQELERQRPLLARLRGEAEPLAAFYGALQDVSRLSPLYRFPLPRYLIALREALALREAPDLTFGGEEGTGTGAGTGAVSADVLVAHLMARYRPCLFQGHAGVLRLLVAVAMSHHGEGRPEAERAAFLRGLGDEDFPGSAQPAQAPPTPPTQLPDWIPRAVQAEVLRLESLPSFGGLVSSLTSCPEQWAEYLRYPSSTVIGPVPCPSHSHLSVLQRALLWKTLLPHWLAAVANDLAACQLGKPFQSPLASDPHPGTPEALSQILEETEGPIVLILPGPSEPGPPPVHPLHWVEQAAQGLAEDRRVKRVQVISFGAECQREVVLKALDLAAQEGHWLVFNNCHLLDQWDEEVVCRVTQLLSCTDGGHVTDVEMGEGPTEGGPFGQTQVHPRFRLWFITRGDAPLSIPAAVRSSALRLACNSPWDLKEALRCSLRQAAAAVTDPVEAGPVLRCAVLHAVLLQRRTYGHLGQGRAYCWTREDLQALLEAQVRTARHCSDPVGALEYIAGSLVYGGHVEDPADLEAVTGVARACLRPPPPLWGRGPHTLSALVARGRFGRRGLLQEVEQRLQASSPSADPLLLGLSAGLAEELLRAQSHALHLLLRDSQTAGVQPRPPVLPKLTQARDRLRALRDTLERAGGRRVTPQTPLGLFLQQEWNGLVRSAASLHGTLPQTDGSRAPHATLRAPHATLRALSRLEARAELLGAYLRKESPETPPFAYRLSAFHSPRGFLAAVLREAARAEKKGDPSRLSLHFQVLSAGTVPSSTPPSGAYLCGLELRGALWDTRLSALQDTLSPKPCPMPLVWVRARTGPADTPGGASSSLPLYHCPLYLDGEFGEGDIVARVPLAAKLDPVLCALRPVRLVSTLQERPHPLCTSGHAHSAL
ncbi:dynein heavy chain domain-containing protein 1 [Anguilla anguilla]|uniref:dynein heavy chain domain-containing protein 1 n=1 Tax=Anguilla anguilla TaxID=7936 RepID=UPI0015B088A7|nr:dynein heavy chain domain-containing protein 1 [Anguilla anguilla]